MKNIMKSMVEKARNMVNIRKVAMAMGRGGTAGMKSTQALRNG